MSTIRHPKKFYVWEKTVFLWFCTLTNFVLLSILIRIQIFKQFGKMQCMYFQNLFFVLFVYYIYIYIYLLQFAQTELLKYYFTKVLKGEKKSTFCDHSDKILTTVYALKANYNEKSYCRDNFTSPRVCSLCSYTLLIL